MNPEDNLIKFIDRIKHGISIALMLFDILTHALKKIN